jgi:hypothetical protein
MDTKAHPFNDAGRRLLAALISYNMDCKGVDSTLKTVPEVVDVFWADAAERLLFAMADHLEKQLFGPPVESDTVQ